MTTYRSERNGIAVLCCMYVQRSKVEGEGVKGGGVGRGVCVLVSCVCVSVTW